MDTIPGLVDGQVCQATMDRLLYAASLCNDASIYRRLLELYPILPDEYVPPSRLCAEYLASMSQKCVAELIPDGVGPPPVNGVGFTLNETKFKPIMNATAPTNTTAVPANSTAVPANTCAVPGFPPIPPAFTGVSGIEYEKIVRARLLQDTCLLNKTHRRLPMPDICLPSFDDMMCHIEPGMKFVSYDLVASFFQMPLHPDVRNYYAFYTPDGTRYRYCVLPMGCYLACEVLQAHHTAICEAACHGLPDVKFLVYIDNVRFASHNTASLLKAKDRYLQLCKDARLTLNVEPGNDVHTTGDFCGITYSTTTTAEVCLPPAQLDKLKDSFKTAYRSRCTVKDYMSLISRHKIKID